MVVKQNNIFFTLLGLSLFVFLGQCYVSWKPIQNVKDPYIQDIAKFVVNTYNNMLHEKTSYNYLDYTDIIKGKYVDAGLDDGRFYRLNVLARNHSDGALGNYEARAFVDTWFNAKKYISLKHL